MSRYLLIVLLLCFSSIGSVSASLPAGISVNIEPMLSEYSSNDKLEIKVSYTNTSDQPVSFLIWHTALEGMVSHDFLDITFDGRSLSYIGIHAKRLPPKDSDYISLNAKQTVEAIVDIEGAYPIEEKGEYFISYKTNELAVESFKKQTPVSLVLLDNKPVRLVKQTPIIDASCNATQVAQINEALIIAEQIAIIASRDLDNAPVAERANAQRYIEWFGAFSPARYDTVANGMREIASALVNQRIGFDCTCDISFRENVFAFVFANDPFNMNVCPVFFRVSPAGTDSRSGTIVHEISHFTVVAGTDDFQSALNQSGSRTLANNFPEFAIRNANAFEYFAENTPFLSMPAPAATTGNDDTGDGDVAVEPEEEVEIEGAPVLAPIVDLLLDE